jgi:glutamate-5-semialdehyde dehydrogenase
MNFKEEMTALALQAKNASRQMNRMHAIEKNDCLKAMADSIEANTDIICEANSQDIDVAQSMNLSPSMLDRLMLDQNRITGMAQGLRDVAVLEDPTGKIQNERKRPSGLNLKKISCPIGVIVMIYESRPNVTADSAGLCFKSGNAIILRGGKEASHSNQIICKLMVDAGVKSSDKFPEHCIQIVKTPDRKALPELLSLTELIDLCIPRGGEGLIRAVAECSRVPVIKHYKGICSVYIDKAADITKAVEIAVNSKTHRAAVCNAMETLLIDNACADTILPSVADALLAKGVELRCCETARSLIGEAAKMATTEDWDTEYLDLICSVRIVEGITGALEHINTHGSGHTECIVTEDESAASRFQHEVDSSTVFWNASTRFSDGGEFGMGAEIGISTDKIGARGPMGLDELTTYKWLGEGDGLTRS